eukprot:365870-Chlamydomonas_euryale.AAC.9
MRRGASTCVQFNTLYGHTCSSGCLNRFNSSIAGTRLLLIPFVRSAFLLPPSLPGHRRGSRRSAYGDTGRLYFARLPPCCEPRPRRAVWLDGGPLLRQRCYL